MLFSGLKDTDFVALRKIINQGWFIPDDVCHKVARYLCKEEDDFTKTGCPYPVNTLPCYLKVIFIEFSVCAAQIFYRCKLSLPESSGHIERHSALPFIVLNSLSNYRL